MDIYKLFESTNPQTQCSGISVILPVRGGDRTQAIQICIDHINKQNINPLEIIIIEEDTKQRINITGIKHILIESTQPFNKSKCINCGVANAKYNKICMNDADMIMQNGFLNAVSILLDTYEAGHIVKEIFYLNKLPTPNIEFSYNRQWTRDANFNCHGGNLFWTKPGFIKTGGMDERFIGHGSEDSEFYLRALKTCKFYDERSMTLLHLPHTLNPSSQADATKNQQLWAEISKIPLDQQVNNLRNNLSNKWNLK